MSYKKRPNFYESDEAAGVEQILKAMQSDVRYSTDSSYSANTEKHPDNSINFVDKHMEYLHTHPGVDPTHYIANLRLITKLR